MLIVLSLVVSGQGKAGLGCRWARKVGTYLFVLGKCGGGGPLVPVSSALPRLASPRPCSGDYYYHNRCCWRSRWRLVIGINAVARMVMVGGTAVAADQGGR